MNLLKIENQIRYFFKDLIQGKCDKKVIYNNIDVIKKNLNNCELEEIEIFYNPYESENPFGVKFPYICFYEDEEKKDNLNYSIKKFKDEKLEMKSYNLELIFKNTIIINYYQKERSRVLFSIKSEMDEKTDIHFILRLIDEYKNKVDEYYFDMEEKQGEENERNKVWFLNYGVYEDDDEEEDVDDVDDDDDYDDVYKFGVDFNKFKESQNISIL